MGNTASCTPIVVKEDGSVREYSSSRRRSVRAAELMFDNPGRFVCDSSQLSIGSRIPGLAAYNELEPRHVYFLLPVDLLYSVLTEEEMATLSDRALSRKRRGSTGSKKNYISRKIVPVLSEFCLIPSEAKKIDIIVGDPPVVTVDDCRVSRQRAWRPALDTIQEAI